METINILGIAGVAAIVIICFMIGLIVKATGINNKWFPVICGEASGSTVVLQYMPHELVGHYFVEV